MAEEDRKFRPSADVLGGVLFTLSSFPLVLVVMDLFREPGSGGAASAARWLVGGLGHAAPILWAGGFSVVGVLMVLGRDSVPVLRTLGGISGTALGLSILLGGVTPHAGGAFGTATGGAVAARLTEPVAIFFGVVCVLAPVWFAWLRGMISENSGREAPGAAVLSEEHDGGVSSEEAALLVPSESSLEYLEEAWREVRQAERPPTLAPSPYPEDPRLQGSVPEGAVPIEPKDAQERRNRPAAAQASHWKRSKGDVRAEVGAGADLAAEEDAALAAAGEPVEERAAQSPGLGASAAPGGELEDPVELIERRLEALEPVPAVEPMPEIEPVRPRARTPEVVEDPGGLESPDPVAPEVSGVAEVPGALGIEARAAAAPADPLTVSRPDAGARPLDAQPLEGSGAQAIRASGPPKPSWEQADLFVDEGGESPEDPGVEVAEVPGGAEPRAELEEELEGEAEEELGEDEEEYEEEYEYEEGEEEDDEEEGEEEDDVEYEEDEDEDEDDVEYEDDDELEDEDEEYEEEDEEDEEEDEEDEEDEESAELEELEELEEPEEPEDLGEAAVRDGEDPEEDDPEDDPEAEGPGELQPEPEPEVVLQPQAAPEAARIPSQPTVVEAAGSIDPQLLYDAGVHFLEEGRVAVSMLQRKFGLDFDQACEILDQLQGRGLIGPYLGGQRRDILMSLEQWEETVTQS